MTNLERPGGNATGIIPRADGYTTRLEILNALLRGSAPIGYLFNPTYGPGVGTLEQTRRAASAVSVALDVVQVNNVPELDAAFARFAAEGARAVLVGNHGLFRRESRRLVELSMQRRIPMVSPYPEARDAGALVSFVPDFEFWSRRAAVYVERILAGAKAGELPVEQSVPSRYTINLVTAAALGIEVPDRIIRRMDRVIR